MKPKQDNREIKITHVNPMCLDSRFCLPHTETGEVEYDIEKMLDYIKKLEKNYENKI